MQFQAFVTLKHEELQRVALAKGISVPPEAEQFFAAVRSNNWSQAESLYMEFEGISRQQDRYDDAIFRCGMQDVSGLYDLMGDWNDDLAVLYIHEALLSIPDGSVIFGGTDAGRFLIAYGAEVLRTGAVTVVTQNALADNTYADYLRHALHNRLDVFTQQDSNTAFQEYVDGVKSGRIDSEGSLSFTNGRVTVTGVNAVMGINGMIARKLHEQNRNTHPFYVEESYAIDWMYPYLVPHGLIMKLHTHPIEDLSPEMIKADQEYWRKLESRLNSIPDLSKTESARRAFSKCRSAIGGLYSHRGLYDEAVMAFRQALRFCPTAPEPHFRLADLYKQQGEYALAKTVITEYMAISSEDSADRINKYLNDLETLGKGEP